MPGKSLTTPPEPLNTHVTDSQSFIEQGKYLSMKYFVQLSVCMEVCMDVPFCLLCMHNLYMYICICMLSTVGSGVLTCSIIVLYLLYWTLFKEEKITFQVYASETLRSFPICIEVDNDSKVGLSISSASLSYSFESVLYCFRSKDFGGRERRREGIR